eukprot:TRINITY_DN1453_c0_g1_i2.p1 TRINITY_DN1453_c0_g1~~TRINITY_DN1453_c0_g1_i2.p1  ORF type:complete len:292 (+),score=82.30 TRINITY_DN1453_c0_g1_i2:124-876(+)
MRPRALPLAMLLASLQGTAAFHFQIEEGRMWCFIEDLRGERTLVHLSYKIAADFNAGEGVELKVTSPRGSTVHSDLLNKREGQVQMTTQGNEGPHAFCVNAPATSAIRMSLDIETHETGTGEWTEHTDPASGRKFYHNPRTKESQWELPKQAMYASTIKEGKNKGGAAFATSREDIDAHHQHMLAVQALMSQIKEESSYLRQRQQRFKITTETTADRVWWLSLFQIVISLVIPAVQTMQLKRMFVKKKLV